MGYRHFGQTLSFIYRYQILIRYTREVYLKIGVVHQAKDTEIDQVEIKEVHTRLNCHIATRLKIINIVSTFDHQDRMHANIISNSTSPVPMYRLAKNHKPADIYVESVNQSWSSQAREVCL